jgi:hypothetical protein
MENKRNMNMNIVVPQQHGFRKGIYMANAAFRLTNDVVKPVNQKVLQESSVIWQKLV